MRHVKLLPKAAPPLLVLVAVACSGGGDGGVSASSTSSTSSTSSASSGGTSSTSSGGSSGTSASGGSSGAPAPCSTAEVPDDAIGVFVAPTGADAPTAGTRAAPLKTITAAIEAAKGLGRARVYVAPGSYPEGKALALPDTGAPITIEGGWIVAGAAWTRACTADARAKTTIVGGGTALVTSAKGGGIAHLTISATFAFPSLGRDAAGGTSAGVVVRGAGARCPPTSSWSSRRSRARRGSARPRSRSARPRRGRRPLRSCRRPRRARATGTRTSPRS